MACSFSMWICMVCCDVAMLALKFHVKPAPSFCIVLKHFLMFSILLLNHVASFMICCDMMWHVMMWYDMLSYVMLWSFMIWSVIWWSFMICCDRMWHILLGFSAGEVRVLDPHRRTVAWRKAGRSLKGFGFVPEVNACALTVGWGPSGPWPNGPASAR